MMAYSIFPPVDLADEHGILAVGGYLEPGILIEAYSKGIFPWPIPEYNAVPWFSPRKEQYCFLIHSFYIQELLGVSETLSFHMHAIPRFMRLSRNVVAQ
jgi:Leu/Phe-tRNA-protein transferase